MRIHSPKMTNAEATGSFSGSFTGVGNFTGLEADSVAYANVLNKPTLISGSEQVTITATTGFSNFSSSISTDIVTEKGRVDAILQASGADADSFKEIVDLINSVDTENDAAFAGYVTSSGNRLTSLESSVAGLDSTYATDVSVSNLSGSANTARGVLAADIATNTSAISNLDNTYASDSQLTSVSGALDTNIKAVASDLANLDSTYASDSQLTSVSGALDTSIKAVATDLSNLDSTYASDSQLTSVSGALDSNIKANASAIAGLDSTYATDAQVASAVGVLSGSVLVVTDSLNSAIAGLDSTYATDAALGVVDGKANTNASNIASNDTDIATNASGIATNASNISTNTGKLAGIEAGATADQTAAQILAAVKTVDGAGSGLDADLLDGQSSAFYATATSVTDHAALTNNPHSVTKSQVGLGNVTNESKTTLLNNASLTGTVTAPTVVGSDDSTKVATTAFVQDRVDAVIGTAGAALDTLGELSSSLASDQSGLAALTTEVGTKLVKASNLSDLTNATTARANLGLGSSATQNSGVFASSVQGATADTAVQPGDLATVATSGAYSSLTGKPTTISTGQASAITANSLKETNVSTNLSYTAGGTSLVVNSSDGSNASLPAATTTAWGVMTDEDKSKLDGIETSATADQTAAQILAALKTVDGAGSGLDADKLDGQSSAYYGTATAVATNVSNIATNTGKLAGIEAGATADQSAAEILTAIKTVDGAGSGLDADLLDGQTSAYYATAASVTAVNAKDPVLTITGDVSGTATFTNLGNATLTATVADDSHAHVISNVDGLQTALNTKANLAGPALTGNPTAPTQDAANNSTRIATTAFVTGKVNDVIGIAGSTLDTLGELSASLAADQSGLASLTSTVGTKLAKASNLSDVGSAATSRANLGVDTKSATYTGVSGDISINSSGVAVIADDSHNHIIGNVDGLQAALNAKQASGTYNTVIGTDTDVDTSGATVIDNIYMTDGVITSHGTRTLTLANLGYSGASNANYITNNNQLSNGAGYITSYVNNIDMGSGFKVANSAGTDQFTITENEDLRFAGAGATSVSFDPATQKVTISSTDNNTVYSHPSHPGDDFSVDTGALTGATVVSDIDINVTTDGQGHVTDANGTVSTRTLTLANLGYSGASNANYITNNNQLSNGAGYQNSSQVAAAVAAVVDSAPGTLNTLNELAAALGDDANFATTVTNALANKQAAGTYNTIIGTDSDINTSGATIIDNMYMTDGVLTSHGTRVLTLGDLGYSGATNANYITNNTQISNGRGYVIGTKNSAQSNSTIVERTSNGYIHASYFNGTGTFSTSGASSGMGLFTGTNGSDTYGRSYNATAARALLNVANGATNVTNNNQLTNGAGYITGYTNTTYAAGRGLDISGTTFNLETDLRDSITHIGYDSNDYIHFSNNSLQQFVVAGVERLRVDTAGIDVSGRIVADSDITAYSDERLKKDIVTIEGALDKTKALRGVEFTRIADDSRSIGVVAQELEAILPELVLTDDEGMKSVNYAQITGLLIEAVKELSAKVDKLENK